MRKPNDYQTAFGEALSKQLSANQTNASSLAQTIGASPAMISRMANGSRTVSPQWADVIAKALALTSKETAALHRAAALDAGYKLDLTKR